MAECLWKLSAVQQLRPLDDLQGWEHWPADYVHLFWSLDDDPGHHGGLDRVVVVGVFFTNFFLFFNHFLFVFCLFFQLNFFSLFRRWASVGRFDFNYFLNYFFLFNFILYFF